MLGARAAHALYRDFFARERRPEYALGMARTLAAFDPERARPLLEKLVASNHPLCVNARPELVQLVIASAGESRQTIATVQPISSS